MMLEVLTNIDNKEKLSSVPIVFLHAFPLSLRMWKPQMEYLEARRIKISRDKIIRDLEKALCRKT